MKLSEIQQKLKAPKNQRNSFGNYNYRNCEDILEALKPLLGDSVLTISDEIVQVGDRFYVKATATFSDGPLMKDANVSVTAYARESLDKKGMDSAQITGAASSYARKYALNGLFLIDDTKDADNQDNRSSEASKPSMKPYEVKRAVPAADDEAGGAVIQTEEAVYTRAEIDEMAKDKIRDLMRALSLPTTKQSVLKASGIEMRPENYEKIIKKLEATKDATDPLAEVINDKE